MGEEAIAEAEIAYEAALQELTEKQSVQSACIMKYVNTPVGSQAHTELYEELRKHSEVVAAANEAMQTAKEAVHTAEAELTAFLSSNRRARKPEPALQVKSQEQLQAEYELHDVEAKLDELAPAYKVNCGRAQAELDKMQRFTQDRLEVVLPSAPAP